MRWTRWTEFKKRRRSRYDKKSTAAPVNTIPPSFWDGGDGLLLAHVGEWDNYPTTFLVEWLVNGTVVQYGTSYYKPSNVDISAVTLRVTASNDNGSTVI